MIKGVLTKVMEGTQCAFVVGRHIHYGCNQICERLWSHVKKGIVLKLDFKSHMIQLIENSLIWCCLGKYFGLNGEI